MIRLAPSALLRPVPWVVNGLTVTVGLALVQVSIGLGAGAAAAQVAIGTAVCASLADVVAPTPRVARRVGVAVVASTAAATLFLAARTQPVLLLPTVAFIMLAAMLLLSWGPKAGSVSFATALSLVFAMSTPDTETLTWQRFGWGLAGSAGYWLWAVVTARLLQPAWRRFALASTAEALARLLAAISRQIADPADDAWQSGILDQEAALADRLQTARDLIFPSGDGAAARRETALLLHLIDLRDLAMASNLEAGLQAATPTARHEAELLGRVVGRMADALGVVAGHLRSGAPGVVDAEVERSLRALLAELEQAGTTHPGSPGIGSLLRSKLALLRSIQALLAPASVAVLPCERSDLRRYITPDEWRFGAVSANLRLDAPVFRHALRVCVTASGAYAISRALPWTPHPQWILLTVAAVMQGNLAETLARRNARVLGTLAGCVVVMLLALSPSTAFLAACFLVAAGVAHAFFGVRYAVTAGAAAVMAVLQAHLAAPGVGFGVLERFGDTVAGALLGWAATYALPTWERTTFATVLRRATDALGAYAVEATTLGDDPASLPRFSRQRAYDALRALSVIRTRSRAEPAAVQVPVAALTAWLAAAYSLMAQLSNIRLALTLRAAEADPRASDELESAMAAAAALLTATLAAAPSTAAPEPKLQALASVAHLSQRVQRALGDAARIAAASARMGPGAP